MHFLTPILSTLLLTGTTLASPLSRRAAALGQPIRRSKFGNSGLMINNTNPDNKYADQTSTNWGGAVIVSTDVTEVTGTFTVPTPSPPSGGDPSTNWCGAAWVGIDGDTCQSGLIQTGVFYCVQDGAYTVEAWYEYISAASIAYQNVGASIGDQITVTVTMTGSNSGTTTLENLSTGNSDSHTFTNDEDGTLCGENAEWIVEDYESGGSLVPFADFGTVTFTGASAVVGGSTVTPGDDSDVVTLDLTQSGTQYTDTSIDGGTVTVNYA